MLLRTADFLHRVQAGEDELDARGAEDGFGGGVDFKGIGLARKERLMASLRNWL